MGSSFPLESAPLRRREPEDREVTVRRCSDPREAEWESWPSFEDDRCIRRGGTGGRTVHVIRRKRSVAKKGKMPRP